MERKLASIQKIEKVWEHSNADRLELARVLGWNVIVMVDEYKAGDLTIYIEIDSICPPEPWADFLIPRKYRIKTQKLRGELSQGICFPLKILEGKLSPKKIAKLKIGEDLTVVLNIRKYIPPHLRPRGKYYAQNSKSLTLKQKIVNFFFKRRDSILRRRLAFPTKIVPKTKETRINNSPSILRNHEGDLVDITEKVDGMSMTAIRRKGKWKLYSRNWQVSNRMNGPEEVIKYKTAFNNSKMESRLKKYVGDIAIQGEVVGPTISSSGKGNIYDFKEIMWYVFNVWDIDKQSYFNYFEYQIFCKKYGLLVCPKLASMRLLGTIEDMIEATKGRSRLNKNIHREGLVVRSRDFGHGEWDFSFKAINPDYLLKYEE